MQMQNIADTAYGDTDPLALQTEAFRVLEYGDSDATKSSSPSHRQNGLQIQLPQFSDLNSAELKPEPLFPITKAMRERIKRMKRRMLATLKLSEAQLAERRRRRAKQTRDSRQRTASVDTQYRRKETDKKMARTSTQRAMETPEQQALRMARKREEGRRYLARRRETETPEQRAARREYQRIYNRNRKPIKFL